MENMEYGQQERLKDIVEKEAEEDIDLTPHEHERALRRAYRSFVMSGKPKTDINSYSDQAEPHIETLIKNQLKEMGSTKIIMTLYVRWKKLNPLNTKFTKWPNTLKQFVGKLPTNCLSVFGHFVGLAFKGLKNSWMMAPVIITSVLRCRLTA